MSVKELVIDGKKEVLDDLNSKIVYVLCMKNEKRGRIYDADGNPIKDPEYPNMRNCLTSSSISWPKDTKDPFTGKDRKPGKYLIRFYEGCTTLFVDEQPKEKEAIDQFVASTRKLFFVKGFLETYGYETMLNKYLEWASWNEESPYRIPQVNPLYKKLDIEKSKKHEAEMMDKVDEAMAFAKKSPAKKMRVHARFLDIADIDLQTMQPLSDDAIRTEYRKAAMNDPEKFMRTFNDKTLHLRVWIENEIARGTISTKKIPNKVVWAEKGIEICDISGLQTQEGILNKLVEYAVSDGGVSFKEMLESINK